MTRFKETKLPVNVIYPLTIAAPGREKYQRNDPCDGKTDCRTFLPKDRSEILATSKRWRVESTK